MGHNSACIVAKSAAAQTMGIFTPWSCTKTRIRRKKHTHTYTHTQGHTDARMEPYLSFSWRQALKEASYQLGHSVRKGKKKRADLTKLRDSFHAHHCLVSYYFTWDRSMTINGMMYINCVKSYTSSTEGEITGVSSVRKVTKFFFFFGSGHCFKITARSHCFKITV